MQLGVNFADVEITFRGGQWHAVFTPLSLQSGPGKQTSSRLSKKKKSVELEDVNGRTELTSVLEAEYDSGL